MKKRSKPRVWQVWVWFERGRPYIFLKAYEVPALRERGCNIRLCEIREVPKPRKARRKK